MDLWIRSQDKEKLVLTKGFETQHTNYDGGCQIFAVWENNYQMVGKYKNKKRALEVLDEIMELLKNEEILHIRKSSLNELDGIEEPKYILKPVSRPKVYEMPID